MKKYCLLFVLFISYSAYCSDSYEIKNVLIKSEAEDGTFILDNYDLVKEPRYILYPTVIDAGEYSVQLKRIDNNLYQIVNTEFYIVTKYCYEYGYFIDAVLEIKNKYNYNNKQRSYGTVIITKN